jgi:hypothetical protein
MAGSRGCLRGPAGLCARAQKSAGKIIQIQMVGGDRLGGGELYQKMPNIPPAVEFNLSKTDARNHQKNQAAFFLRPPVTTAEGEPGLAQSPTGLSSYC